MKSRTALLESSLKVFAFAATALLIGCAGVSSRTADSVTGGGTAASTHRVNLSWNGSMSADISGYNIYRAVYTDSCKSFSKINPVLNKSTSYTDSEVMGGTSYCYATTAVNLGNEESGYSEIVLNVQIPAE